MNRRMERVLALAMNGIVVLSACRAAAPRAPETMALRIGEERKLTGSPVNLSIVRLVEDSRCPVAATCVWAGNAAIMVRVHTGTGMSTTYTLNTTTPPTSIATLGFEFRLDSLVRGPAPSASTASGPYLVYVTVAPEKP